jgi:ribosomal protein S12 methylthiotransferase
MQALPKVCNYLDIPLQHANDQVLARMRRQITRKETTDLIRIAREKVPNIAIRTTMLVGFPNESDSEFEDLLDFTKEMRFDRLGAFQYSHEENTSAYQMEDNVPTELKQERVASLMELQSEISAELNQAKIGKTFKVLFDRKEGEYFIGRTEADSPEVDNEVLVKASTQYVRIGDFANVRITETSEYDLYGELVLE